MILIKIKLNQSKIHGIGCFTKEFVKKGQIIWRFEKDFDLVLKKDYVDKLPLGAKENFLNYAYISRTSGDYVLCSDDSKFFNHNDKDQNVTCVIPEGFKTNDLVCFALRDIQEGEELTCDYREFDADPSDVIIKSDND